MFYLINCLFIHLFIIYLFAFYTYKINFQLCMFIYDKFSWMFVYTLVKSKKVIYL